MESIQRPFVIQRQFEWRNIRMRHPSGNREEDRRRVARMEGDEIVCDLLDVIGPVLLIQAMERPDPGTSFFVGDAACHAASMPTASMLAP